MTADISRTIAASVPIILLIGLGYIVRLTRVLSEGAIEELKGFIVRVALPAVLFRAFLTVELTAGYLGIFVMMPVVLVSLLLLGFLVERPLGGMRSTPFLLTGFEFGMLGISLFGTAYGMDQVGIISVVGLPHELFIWFVYVTVMSARYGAGGTIRETVRSFLRSPIIIAIASGAILNVLGLGPAITASIITRPILRAMELLGGVIAPLILVVIGYGMRIAPDRVRGALPTVLVRYAVILTLLFFAVRPLVEGVMGLPRIVSHAVATFLLLPPPYIVPLYVPGDRPRDLAYANNVLSVYTLLSITSFLVYFWLNPV